jgi:antitoxin component YwqK of YwqJK toxin-antitoxin module
MNKILIFVPVFLLIIGCGEKVVDSTPLVNRDDLWYEANSDEPFTGREVWYWPNGNTKDEMLWRDGMPHGKSTTWYENGQKIFEGEYRNGTPYGIWTKWNEDGEKISETMQSSNP